jgi:hypothetical protein
LASGCDTRRHAEARPRRSHALNARLGTTSQLEQRLRLQSGFEADMLCEQ